METRLVKVIMTRADVRTGVPGDAGRCPVAIAITRATGSARVTVGPHYITVGYYTTRTPPEAVAFIQAYDAAGPEGAFMPPIEFELKLPRA